MYEFSDCKDKFLTFEFEDNFLVVLDREEATTASSDILKEHAIPSVRSSDLSEPYVDTEQEIQKPNDDFGDSPVTNYEMGVDCLLWAWTAKDGIWISVQTVTMPVNFMHLDGRKEHFPTMLKSTP